MNILQAHPVRTLVAALVGSVICCVFSFPTNLEAQVFRPEKGAMWDPSILWHDGQFHAFMNKDSFSLRSAHVPPAYKTVWIDMVCDLQTGVILEGTLCGTVSGARPAAGFVFDEGNDQSMAVLLGIGPQEGRETHIGRLIYADGDGQFNPEDVTGKYSATVTGLDPDCEHRFRLLARLGLFELYVDDRLMQTYAYRPTSGRLGFVVRDAELDVRDLTAWRMSLPAENSLRCIHRARSPSATRP
ncbi:MAG: hypothetical protein ACYC3X_28930 [Pirellulaceae bacterium]